MSIVIQVILYGILVTALGAAGYFIGKHYQSIGTMIGVGVGVGVGAFASGIVWWLQESSKESFYD